MLTGGNSDGTNGLRAIKAAGGLCVVQEPEEAANPSMLLSALYGDHPDHVVSLDELAGLLTRLVRAGGRTP